MPRSIILCALFFSLGQSDAATFVVDRIDDDPAFFACTDAPIDCSLRGAIVLAELSPGADEIIIPADTFELSLNGADGGQLQIGTEIAIRGAGMTQTILSPAGAFGNLRAIRVENGGALTLQDLALVGFGSVSDESSALVGGAIVIDDDIDSTFTATRVRFADNQAALGGAIAIGSTGDPGEPVRLRISESLLENNRLNSVAVGLCGGGAIRIAGASAVIEDTEIRDNSAGENSGGGICLNVGGELFARDVRLLRNSAEPTRFGGGLYLADGSTAVFVDSQFDNNSGPGAAAAINNSQLTIEDSLVIGNDSSGGTLSFENDARGIITRTSLAANTSRQIFASDSELELNTVNISGLRNGITVNASNLSASGLLIANHRAERGAGLNAELSLINLNNCLFRDNEASDDTMASGLGGAIYLEDSLFDASNCTWHDNRAIAAGGAISVTGTTSTRISNSTFSNNSAASGESLQALNSSGVELNHVTIAANNGNSSVRLINSSLALGNSAIEGFCEGFGIGNTATSLGGNVVTDSSCDLGGAQDQQVPQLGLLGLGNFGGDPVGNVGLVAPVHLPNPDSPVIDASDNDCAPTDQRGQLRDSPCDAGAVERQVGDEFLFSDGFET